MYSNDSIQAILGINGSRRKRFFAGPPHEDPKLQTECFPRGRRHNETPRLRSSATHHSPLHPALSYSGFLSTAGISSLTGEVFERNAPCQNRF